MANILRQHFPMLREREDILGEINTDKKLSETFYQWTKKQQEDFLDICTGIKGVKILYDAFFKEIMNPEYAPERLNEILSLLLAKKVKICKVLPTDSTRIADESSLLIMDILVELEDKSLANVEVQKIGYHMHRIKDSVPTRTPSRKARLSCVCSTFRDKEVRAIQPTFCFVSTSVLEKKKKTKTESSVTGTLKLCIQ
jgi:hypothetical protein